MKRIVLALAIVAGLASVAAADQGPQRQRGQMRQRLVEQFDQNRDGRLTGREKRAAKKFVMRKRFERRMMALRECRQQGRRTRGHGGS